ncbi:ABC transporter ATP-binding protein [Halovulum sp. GXIMD14793]
MQHLHLAGVEKAFGDTPVLRGIDLAVEPGDFLTLVGPSGCGKSTLLRILAGLEAPDAGRVIVDGRDMTDVRPAARNLAMVFQSYALYPHLTVAENMMTPLKLRDLGTVERLPLLGPLLSRSKRTELLKQVHNVAETLQITPLLDRKPGQLSGGQRQRAALGRAMVRRPEAFLMDEPLSNLDAALRVHMRAELSELHRRLETTFVYVTHDQAEALTMSTRMAVMMGGRILQLGAPDEIYTNPTSIEVARFVGTPRINILPTEVGPDGALGLEGELLPVRVDAKGPLQLGIRPEHIALALPRRAKLTARLKFRENLGADVFLHATTGEGNEIIARALPAEAQGLNEGDMLHLSLDPTKVLLFGQDGQRVNATTQPARAYA